MRILGLAAAGLILAGPAFAQPALVSAGTPPSPYATPPVSGDASGGAAVGNVNSSLYGAPASGVGGDSALGGMMQTFDTIGAVRDTTPTPGAATELTEAPSRPRLAAGVSAPALDPTPPPGSKAAKPL